MVEADRARRDIRPLPGAFPAVVGIWPPISDALEDHTESLPGKGLRAQPQNGTVPTVKALPNDAKRTGLGVGGSGSRDVADRLALDGAVAAGSLAATAPSRGLRSPVRSVGRDRDGRRRGRSPVSRPGR
ncbi:hypothetical protein GCM10010518_49470 [Kitasatospora cinereorecta]